ncbi:MAG TPA: rhomboid family intramembrane serine protease [Puia sp.]|jgi:membrane associated rhomboid family serine protease|nr:rhomboid family intramembrane serine protease [Puia sp.]
MNSFTVSIIVITCIISFLSFNNRRVMDALIFYPPAVSHKYQYYRFLTCGFIHADMVHLLFNMVTLFFFGKALENYYMGVLGLQHYYFLILYLTSLIAASIPSYLKHRDDYNYRSLGASGAVCAVQFAFILIDPWSKLYVWGIPMPAILFVILFLTYSIYMSKRGGDNINHSAHLWGALYGVLFTIAARPSVVSIFIDQIRQPRF